MKKMKFLLFCTVLLSSLTLFSCEIDEEENLLFQLKDNLQAAGTWEVGGELKKFVFEIDGTFTYTDNDGSRSGSGSYRYSENFSESIFDTASTVGTFYLTWKTTSGGPTTTGSVSVTKKSNGDLQFTYDGKTYIQTG